jgi:hypothetical protein
MLSEAALEPLLVETGVQTQQQVVLSTTLIHVSVRQVGMRRLEYMQLLTTPPILSLVVSTGMDALL